MTLIDWLSVSQWSVSQWSVVSGQYFTKKSYHLKLGFSTKLRHRQGDG